MQNLSTSILTKYFAKWSSPYSNKLSNMAKLILPFSSIINSNIYKMANLLGIRYRPTLLETSEYEYRINTFGKYSEVLSEINKIKYKDGRVESVGKTSLKDVGQYDDISFNMFPITGCILNEIDISPDRDIYTEDIAIGESILDFTFATPCRVYLSATRGQQEDISVFIYGNDIAGNVISEEFTSKTSTTFETFHKYKNIYKVVSNCECQVSNSVNLSINHHIESNVAPYRLITNRAGDFIDPSVRYSAGQISIIDKSSFNKEEIVRIDAGTNLKKIYLTMNSEIIALDDSGWINTYKPSLPYSEIGEINGSLNNNEYIYVEDEVSVIGEAISCRVYAHKIAERFRSTNIKVSIRNGDAVYFLNKNGYLTQDTNSWIDIVRSADILNVSVICDNNLPYVFSVNTDNSKEVFLAAAYQDNPNRNMIIGGISDMFLYNGEIVVKRDNKFFIFQPYRHSYATYDEDEIILDAEYSGIELK